MNSYVLAVLFGLLMIIGTEAQGQVYCGRHLASTLAYLCENGLIKRSDVSYEMEDEFSWPWIPVHRAKAMGRGKRQVVTECCDKPCTINELLSYCAP